MSSNTNQDNEAVIQLVDHIDPSLVGNVDDSMGQEVRKLWESVVRVCNKTLNQANVYGFHLMHIPDPNITAVIQAIELQATPMLQALINKGYLKAEDEIKLINIENYLRFLQDIVVALKANDREAFDLAVERLSRLPMVQAS
ncbi:TPA: hypothetical protein VGT11_002164 [Vibrio cholerae]|nr:hypothetical protein [Vibrio cholerae]